MSAVLPVDTNRGKGNWHRCSLLFLVSEAQMAVVAAVIALFAGWMLWGWLVSEHHDIVWMRRWCASIFVVTAILISTVAGSVVTAVVLRARHRADVREFATSLESRLTEGQLEAVLAELRSVMDPPDEWSRDSNDVLDRMSAAASRLNEPPPAAPKSTRSASSRARLQ